MLKSNPPRPHRLCAAIAVTLGSLLSLPAAQAAAVIPLSSLDGSTGFRLDGATASGYSGFSVSAAGDINGDGIDDLIISDFRASPNGVSYAGSSYVVFGRTGGFDAAINLSTLDGSTGFRLDGAAGHDYSGFAVAAAGDINGDGIDDLIIGASGADPNGVNGAGSSYVVFGRTGGFDAAINLSTLDGSTGFRLDGVAAGDSSGRAVAAAGDINGDGIDDLIIGAALASPNGQTFAGSSYVVFGRTSGFDAVINLSTLDGSTGFRLDGAAALDRSGRAVSAAGDINGDGIDDLIIGAHLAAPSGMTSAGSSYVVFGRTGSFDAAINLSTLDGSTGFRLDGAAAGDLSGFAVSSAGDINGDGIDDLIIGAYLAAPNGVTRAGSSYVVFGRTGSFDAAINLSTLDGSTGFRLDGVAAYDRSGRAVSAAGDINGDGIDDLIVGAIDASPNGVSYAGSSYVVFGRTGGFDAAIPLSTLDGSTGFRLDGVATYDWSGSAVSAAGDINGDGIDDLIIGAYGANPNGVNSAGSSYVVFGNAAPLVVDGASRVIETLEDDVDSAGIDLASLVAEVYLDADPFAGAALDISAPVSANGAWQFRLDPGASWSTIPTSGLSSDNALLLAPDARLRFVPAADFFGAIAPLSLRLWDGTDAASYAFGPGQDIRQSIGGLGGFSNDANRLPVSADILPVNDAPSFSASNPPAVLQDAGAQTVTGWVESFVPGPANESDQQVVGYTVSSISNPALFAVAPTVGIDGSLSYTPAADANGTSTFSVQVQDDGGTANGGVDTSESQTFTITVLISRIFCNGFESGGCS